MAGYLCKNIFWVLIFWWLWWQSHTITHLCDKLQFGKMGKRACHCFDFHHKQSTKQSSFVHFGWPKYETKLMNQTSEFPHLSLVTLDPSALLNNTLVAFKFPQRSDKSKQHTLPDTFVSRVTRTGPNYVCLLCNPMIKSNGGSCTVCPRLLLFLL